MIAFGCPRCRLQMENDDSDAGEVVNCPKCRQAITLPATSTPLPALPPDRPESSEPKEVRVLLGGTKPSFEESAFVVIFFVTVIGGLLLYLLGQAGCSR